jgi:hypothetical protein
MIAHFQRFVKDYFIDLDTTGVYDSAEQRGYDSNTGLRRPPTECAFSNTDNTGSFLLLFQRVTLQCNIVLFYLFVCYSAYSNINTTSPPPPPMSTYSVVSIPQCCIGTTVSMLVSAYQHSTALHWCMAMMHYTGAALLWCRECVWRRCTIIVLLS